MVAERKTYRKGLGLSGRVLEGSIVVSENIFDDPKRSGYHAGKWVNRANETEESPEPRAFLGVPIWTQIADLHRETYVRFWDFAKNLFPNTSRSQ